MHVHTLHCSLVLKVRSVSSLFTCTAEAERAAFHLVIPSRMYAWKLMAPAELPGTKRAKCRWKLSSDVEPRAHLSTGSMTPPLWVWPVTVYNSSPIGSWMHTTCFCCSSQMDLISSFSKGTPRVSVAIEKERSRASIASVVCLIPLVLLLQCLAISSFVMAFCTDDGGGFGIPAATISPLLADMRRSKSSLSHSKIANERRDMNVP